MKNHSSAIATVKEAVSQVCRNVAAAWRFNTEFSERWLDAQRPWEHDGPLRWRRTLLGPRLIGSRLPDPDATGHDGIRELEPEGQT